MYLLQIYDSEKGAATQMVLGGEVITIGRDPACEVILNDINISRKHARIEPLGRFYVVRDLKSTNGTWVNQNPVKMHLLKDGDVVRIGSCRLVVKASGAVHPAELGATHTEIIADPFSYDASGDSGHTVRIDLAKKESDQIHAGREPREQLLRLHDISRKLGFIETPTVLCGHVVEIVLDELMADRAAILIPEGESFRIVAARVAPAEKGQPFNIHQGVLRSAVQDLTAILTEDARSDQRFQDGKERSADRVKSVMCVPLLAQTNLEALVYLDRTNTNAPFKEDDLRFLAVIGNQVAINLANARLFEEVLLEKQKIQAVISSMKDGLVITDPSFVVQSCNAAASEILFPQKVGYPVGKDFLKLLKERDQGFEQGEFQRALRGTRDFGLMVERDKDVRAYAVSVAPFTPGGGERTGFAFSLRDATDFHHLQELKSEFIRNASHKLRTPLTILLSSVDLLRVLPFAPGGSSADLKDMVNGMEKNLQQLESMVNRFLEFAELDRTRFNLREVNLKEVVALAQAGVQSKLQEKGIAFRSDIAPDHEMVVVGDTDRLVQCFYNILENAVKFAPENSIVTVSAGVCGDSILLSVEDEGPGIPSHHLMDIFSGFHQVEKIPTGEVPGAGLGLTIAKRIVHAHSGTITAQSPVVETGKGTRITIALPKAGFPSTDVLANDVVSQVG